jgi:hypothetical protein
VPLTVISPFAKRGFIDHTQYETVSLLTFLEGLYQVPPLNTRDANALPPISAFKNKPDLVIKATGGQPFEYQLPAYNQPEFFFVNGNLDGLQLDPYRGIIFGFPNKFGKFHATVHVPGKNGPVFYSVLLEVGPPAI